MIIAVLPAFKTNSADFEPLARTLNDRPLISFTIKQAQASQQIDDVLVLTDAIQVKEICAQYEVTCYFVDQVPQTLRKVLDSTDALSIARTIDQTLQGLTFVDPEITVILDPARPVRLVEEIDQAISCARGNSDVELVHSVSKSEEDPFEACLMSPDGSLESVIRHVPQREKHFYSEKLAGTYYPNLSILVFRSKGFISNNSPRVSCVRGVLTRNPIHIASEPDLIRAEQELVLSESRMINKNLKICCDIDGVLATKAENINYAEAGPIRENIALINKLYDQGHNITLFTARGTMTGIDWEPVTRSQMKAWGLRYHELKFGKPAADIYLDDKYFTLDQLKVLLKDGTDHG